MAGAVDGAAELITSLTAGAARVDALVPQVVAKVAVDLNGRVQQNASGRPGPNAPTGDYRGSWSPEEDDSGTDETTWTVGTDRAQALRLEYGFVGVDSLGRHYNQPPYAHLGPAVDAIEPVWDAAFAAVADQAVQ